MSSLEKRGLKKAYARCPRCKRILKVRLRKVETRHITSPQYCEWELETTPPHRVYQPDPDKLSKLVKTGKAPDEHPMCSMYGIHTKPTRCQPEHWEIVGWRE